MAVVGALRDAGIRLPYHLEVVAFAEEEGLRFKTSFLASSVLAGRFDPTLLERVDTDGVSMRELRMTARKPGHRPAAQTHQALYLGPMSGVVDDFGTMFRRGVPTPVNVHDWQMLAKSATSTSFLLIKPDDAKEAGCCDDRRPVEAAVIRALEP